MAITETISVLFGLGGIIIGGYSYFLMRSNRKTKSELNDLANSLRDIHSRASKVHERFSTPLDAPDVGNALENVSQSMIAFEFETGKSPWIKAEIYHDDEYVYDGEEALDIYKDGDWLKISLLMEPRDTDYEVKYKYPIEGPGFFMSQGYLELEKIRNENQSRIEEFSPGLLDDFESQVDRVIRKSHDTLGEKHEGREFDLNEYEKVDDVSRAVFDYFYSYEGVENDIEELQNVLERVDEVRASMVQSSYS